MSEKTNIEWATSTGNPWIGCTKVSPGCARCYAAAMDEQRFSKTMGGGTKGKPVSHWGKGAPRFKTKGFWKDAVKWNREAGKAAELHRQRYENETQVYDGAAFYPLPRPRIFPSLCDWLDDEVPIEWLADFLKLIHDTPNLDWLLLTKRPENLELRLLKSFDHLKSKESVGWVSEWIDARNPPSNVWLGVSVEDQKRADERIPLLLQIPARVRFLSVEPLLEPINLKRCPGCGHIFMRGHDCEIDPCDNAISWVIGGLESGKDRRDAGVESIIDLAGQCVAAGVPFYCKQDCALKPGQKGRIPDDVWSLKQFPNL